MSAGYIEAICISVAKGTVKHPVERSEFVPNHGIQGDAHAGPWHRQVSLLAGESIDRMKQKMPELEQGAFAENMITRGVDLSVLEIGSELRIGDNIILRVTQIGKECHHGCAIRERTGECIMPVEGIFAEVVSGGKAGAGDTITFEH